MPIVKLSAEFTEHEFHKMNSKASIRIEGRSHAEGLQVSLAKATLREELHSKARESCYAKGNIR